MHPQPARARAALVAVAAIIALTLGGGAASAQEPQPVTTAVQTVNGADLPPCPDGSSTGSLGGSAGVPEGWATLAVECLDTSNPFLGPVRAVVNAADISPPGLQSAKVKKVKYAKVNFVVKDRPGWYVKAGTVTVELFNITADKAISQEFFFREALILLGPGGTGDTFELSRVTDLEIRSGDRISAEITNVDLTVISGGAARYEYVTIPDQSLPKAVTATVP